LRREIITFATGPSVYKEMAFCLARSVWYWDPGFQGVFTIVTDSETQLPLDLADRVRVKLVPPPSSDGGYVIKLDLHEYSEGEAVLFLDADSLAIGPVSRIFAALENEPFAVFGHTIDSGIWWCDVAQTIERFGLDFLPCFYGELYYFRRGAQARRVFARAKELALHYDEVGFRRLRGRPNEEVVVAVALAAEGIRPMPLSAHLVMNPDRDGAIRRLDSMAGEFELETPSNRAKPVVVHFFASGENLSDIYRREILRWQHAAQQVPPVA
jgi:hypothetical protein